MHDFRVLDPACGSGNFLYIAYREMKRLEARIYENPNFIIDFGTRNMLEASAFPKTLEIVRQRVLPDWEKNAAAEQTDTGKSSGEHQGRLETWWLLKRRRGELLDSIAKLSRFVVCSRVTKRPVFSFLDSSIHPDSSLTCFAFEDDYSFGILQSHAHWLWFTTKCSKLTERFRYTARLTAERNDEAGDARLYSARLSGDRGMKPGELIQFWTLGR